MNCTVFYGTEKEVKSKTTVVSKPIDSGGIGMLDIHTFLGAMKISWMRKIWSKDILNRFTMNLYPRLLDMQNFGSEYTDKVIRETDNPFWKDVCKHFKKLQIKSEVRNLNEFLAECLYYNPNILRDRKTVMLRGWYDAGITKIGHLVNDNGELMTYNEFIANYPTVTLNYLLFEGIIKAVKMYQKKCQVTLSPEYKLIETSVIQCINK